MAVSSFMVPIGTPAPDFALPSLDGVTMQLADLADAPALLVMFLCNHCPYVKHVEARLGEVLADYPELGVVGICSNDVGSHPTDDADHLREQVKRANWTFPYLVDESQQVALAYRAACTPDFFLYRRDRTLLYRGAFDDSTPGNGRHVTGIELRAAIEQAMAGHPVPEPHRPSIGCSIKYRPENQPA